MKTKDSWKHGRVSKVNPIFPITEKLSREWILGANTEKRHNKW